MRWGRVVTILGREYREHIRKKMFWVFSLAVPLLAPLIGKLLIFLLMVGVVKGHKILIYDGAGLGETLAQTLETASGNWGKINEVKRLPFTEGEVDTSPLTRQEVDVIIVLPKGMEEEPPAFQWLSDIVDGLSVLAGNDSSTRRKPRILTRKGGNLMVIGMAQTSINDQLQVRWLEKRGFDAAAVQEVFRKRVEIPVLEVDQEGKTGKADKGLRMFLALTGLMLVMMPAYVWGIVMMESVIEEKIQRIAEILISSVSTTELLAGKILGIGLTGLTQVGIWLAIGVGFFFWETSGMPVLKVLMPFQHLNPATILAVVLFLVLNFFMNLTFFAGVGSLVDKSEDTGPFVFLVSLVSFLPLAFFLVFAWNPESRLLAVFSWIPFYAPSLLTMRLAFGTLTLGNAGLGIAITLVTLAALIWACARVYRVRVLLYGQPVRVLEIVRLIVRG